MIKFSSNRLVKSTMTAGQSLVKWALVMLLTDNNVHIPKWRFVYEHMCMAS